MKQANYLRLVRQKRTGPSIEALQSFLLSPSVPLSLFCFIDGIMILSKIKVIDIALSERFSGKRNICLNNVDYNESRNHQTG